VAFSSPFRAYESVLATISSTVMTSAVLVDGQIRQPVLAHPSSPTQAIEEFRRLAGIKTLRQCKL
jgi:hypothetical protein